tara:strand:+ start:9982 stop:10143 length:162 start_codon:yes stop_codon:yes gene_type:complete
MLPEGASALMPMLSTARQSLLAAMREQAEGFASQTISASNQIDKDPRCFRTRL